MDASDRRHVAPGKLLLSDMISAYVAATFLAQHGFSQYVRQHFLDTTFKGLYQADRFDLALLIPYFIVLTLLATYGIHRYTLVYLYYKKRKNCTTEPEIDRKST